MNFEEEVRGAVRNFGGWVNAHSHPDRAYTMEPEFFEHADMDPLEIPYYPLPVKQHTTGVLHEGPAYSKKSLRDRIERLLKVSIGYEVRRIDGCIDTTGDCVGLSALEVAWELKKEYVEKIDFRVGVYPIFGFKDDMPKRWDVFANGAQFSDFIVTLPERDARPGHIGFNEHFRRVMELANKLHKPVHFHVDQTNHPDENGTETLIEAIRWLRPAQPGEPTVWAVHSLSVASYNEERFKRVVEGLKECNIGVIVCPNATLSNRQDRNVNVPMHNSITRVLDFLLADIPVRIGTDNVEDMFCPENTADMFEEVRTAARSLRFFNFNTWAKVVAGVEINEVDKMKIRRCL
jgi:cytosine/adenosine deaminase-related metal-dependent hydrolase